MRRLLRQGGTVASQSNESSKRRRGGRPAWTPPNLDIVKGLAIQGMTTTAIAAALGISPSTLFKKKRELADFAAAIKRGRAEGEALATSQLFAAVKAGQPWAICFFLKTRHGWRENDTSGANLNVNIGLVPEWEEAERERVKEQKKLIRLLTVDERREYLELMRKAAERQRQQKQPVEVQARPVVEKPASDGED
jgi:hypothetical protein